ncbi:aminotransferase class I/II-fold pyridoxal phosphate-dependent enzyme [Sulfurisoma sediminicola]|uniref:8-amino-7-oxononanoate synthase n=1 Tax=Sulfurisoma sediminicola TaxID=1381557 RepID=A0A497XKQ6_9PROT|nr:aminotransferase class I/II-fold pyridoxal phosphate-dependent enzyme [Sulfurisoma sediminicola]RLJ68572.1 8-amino-7-oxononanoate synthase [Sulfurisoma sediminicola]
MADLDHLIHARLAALAASRQRRVFRVPDPLLIDVSSNDYLGLSRHPLLVERACAWTRRHGAGSRASRLVTGTSREVLELEARLAAFKGAEAALVFASGFQLNSSVLPALFELGAGTHRPLVFTDRLNHASLHAGCRGLRQIRYRHNDLAHLEELLNVHRGELRFIVTESVFSMDGDRADVPALAALAERHDAILYLDEAHATGVLGPAGRGLAMLAPGKVPVVMGTLGKALGGAGAYVAGSRALIDWLINRCAGFIYSTAPQPAAFGALDAALDLVPDMEVERARLATMADALRAALHARGIDTLASSTQIVPAVIGSEEAALAAARRLEEAGVLAVAIRPPTVPAGSARLRFALSAALSDAQFERVLAAVATL